MYSEKWYEKSVSSVEKILQTDISTGLSRKEVQARRQKNGENVIFEVPKTSFRSYLGQIMTDFTFILLLITILIALILERDALLIPLLVVMVFYQFFSIFCYVRAQHVIENMGGHALPYARVMRDGKLYMVRQNALVQGDIIFVSEGDIVPCDARIVEQEGLETLEMNVTGVQRTVSKTALNEDVKDASPANQRNMLFASTIVTKGKGKAVVCEVGRNTLVCVMEKNQPIVNHENLGTLEFIRKFSRFWSIAMICTVFFVAVLDLIAAHGERSLFETFLTSLSLAVSSMSEYLAAFGFLIVACGIFASVRKKRDINSGALIKNVGKLEDLRDVTALVLPLQGVFTTGEPSIELVYANHREYAPGTGDYPEFCSGVIRTALLSTGLYGSSNLFRNTPNQQNARSEEENSIILEAERLNLYNKALEKDYPILEHLPASMNLRLEVTLAAGEGGDNLVAVRGDALEVLEHCAYYAEDGKIFPLTPRMKSEFRIVYSDLIRRSLRVVAAASGTTAYQTLNRLHYIVKNLVFEGFIAFRESILPGAAVLIDKCRENGIKLYMTTDDESESYTRLAHSLGLLESEEQCVKGRDLLGKKEGILHIELPEYRLLQGLDLAQKRLLVRSLKENGEKVGLLTHKLNEIILLKEADVGFAQSVTISYRAGDKGLDLTSKKYPIISSSLGGCEALRYVSDVIVSEATQEGTGGFNSVVRAVLCGKSIYSNLHKMIAYLLTMQSARFLLVLYSIFSSAMLLSPFQILYSGLFMDFLAIVMIAFTPPSNALLSHKTVEWESPFNAFLAHWKYLLIGLFASAFTALTATVLLRRGLIADGEVCCSATFLSLLLTQLIALYGISRERMFSFKNIRLTRFAFFALLAEIALPAFAYFFPSFGKWMGICPIPAAAWIGIGAVNLLILAVFFVLNRIRRERINL